MYDESGEFLFVFLFSHSQEQNNKTVRFEDILYYTQIIRNKQKLVVFTIYINNLRNKIKTK